MEDVVETAALSVMLIVSDAAAAVRWYAEALGAEVLWDLEVFVDAPDDLLARASGVGATEVQAAVDHTAPWGTHRQGGFTDPFGHRWSVGDPSPLRAAQ
jgi:uncharacterized glyoxalase superfamily protein PhnB